MLVALATGADQWWPVVRYLLLTQTSDDYLAVATRIDTAPLPGFRILTQCAAWRGDSQRLQALATDARNRDAFEDALAAALQVLVDFHADAAFEVIRAELVTCSERLAHDLLRLGLEAARRSQRPQSVSYLLIAIEARADAGGTAGVLVGKLLSLQDIAVVATDDKTLEVLRRSYFTLGDPTRQRVLKLHIERTASPEARTQLLGLLPRLRRSPPEERDLFADVLVRQRDESGGTNPGDLWSWVSTPSHHDQRYVHARVAARTAPDAFLMFMWRQLLNGARTDTELRLVVLLEALRADRVQTAAYAVLTEPPPMKMRGPWVPFLERLASAIWRTNNAELASDIVAMFIEREVAPRAILELLSFLGGSPEVERIMPQASPEFLMTLRTAASRYALALPLSVQGALFPEPGAFDAVRHAEMESSSSNVQVARRAVRRLHNLLSTSRATPDFEILLRLVMYAPAPALRREAAIILGESVAHATIPTASRVAQTLLTRAGLEKQPNVLHEVLKTLRNESYLGRLSPDDVRELAQDLLRRLSSSAMEPGAARPAIQMIVRLATTRRAEAGPVVRRALPELLVSFDFHNVRTSERLAIGLIAESARDEPGILDECLDVAGQMSAVNQASLAAAIRRVHGVRHSALDRLLATVDPASRAASHIAAWRSQ